MLAHLRRSVIISVIFLVLTGFIYPAVVTGISQVFFKQTASGSLTPNGSTLVGQQWNGPAWFHGRDDPYAESSGVMYSQAANYGPRSAKLVAAAGQEAAALKKLGIANPTSDLVTSSGSGYDPNISPADAYAQVAMISTARHLPVTTLNTLIQQETHGREWGFLGSPYINVLQLNVALSKLH